MLFHVLEATTSNNYPIFVPVFLGAGMKLQIWSISTMNPTVGLAYYVHQLTWLGATSCSMQWPYVPWSHDSVL